MLKKKLKIALIMNIPPHHSYGVEIPISLLYLGAELINEGHDVAVIDRRTYGNEITFINCIKSFGADLIGLPLFASDYTLNYELINKIRRFLPLAKIILGGPEVTAAREYVVDQFRNRIDYLLSGEAEYTLARLANCLAEHNEDGIHAIEGLSYYIDGEVYHNPLPPSIKEIDDIPFPRRDLISTENWRYYYRPGLGRPTDMIFTSRGCPFTCKFCFRLTKGYRARSPENVLAEIGEIYARGTRGIIIEDDNFTINRKRCIAILEGILQKGWKLNLKCRGRVNSVDPELLKLMKKAGVRSVTFGIESGSQIVLKAMDKRTTVEQNYEAIKMVQNAGLQCYADMFIGYPGETIETVDDTIQFLKKAKPIGINLGYLFPLHGTDVYNESKANGTMVGDWGILEEYPWVKLDWFSDISELREKWLQVSRQFWLNPLIIFRAIKANIFRFSFSDYIDIARALWFRLKG